MTAVLGTRNQSVPRRGFGHIHDLVPTLFFSRFRGVEINVGISSAAAARNSGATLMHLPRIGRKPAVNDSDTEILGPWRPKSVFVSLSFIPNPKEVVSL